jgi:hypothetical protein
MSTGKCLIPSYILNQILVLNLDEHEQKFSRSFMTMTAQKFSNYINNNLKINSLKKNYSIIVVCTQNSLSGTKEHFQHQFKDYMENNGYKMLSKLDATPDNARRTYGFFIKNV